MFTGRTLIPAPHGQLEAIYRPRSENAKAIALLLHPHPQHGGTMHNKVVYRSAKALEELGYETLRINYRGVGDSSGGYDDGRGETEDARTALDYLRDAQPSADRLLLLGFSFGAGIAFRLAATEHDVDRIVSIGTPAYALEAPDARASGEHTQFIHGAEDQIAPLRELRPQLASLGIENAVRVVPGADHFFTGHLGELQSAVKEAAR